MPATLRNALCHADDAIKELQAYLPPDAGLLRRADFMRALDYARWSAACARRAAEECIRMEEKYAPQTTPAPAPAPESNTKAKRAKF